MFSHKAGMTSDPFQRRKNTKLVFGVLTVGIIMSALVAVMLFYLGQVRPGF